MPIPHEDPESALAKIDSYLAEVGAAVVEGESRFAAPRLNARFAQVWKTDPHIDEQQRELAVTLFESYAELIGADYLCVRVGKTRMLDVRGIEHDEPTDLTEGLLDPATSALQSWRSVLLAPLSIDDKTNRAFDRLAADFDEWRRLKSEAFGLLEEHIERWIDCWRRGLPLTRSNPGPSPQEQALAEAAVAKWQTEYAAFRAAYDQKIYPIRSPLSSMVSAPHGVDVIVKSRFVLRAWDGVLRPFDVKPELMDHEPIA